LKIALYILSLGLLLFSFIEIQTFVQPPHFPAPIEQEALHASDAQIALGRQLFYDPILSKDSSISCSSCHLSYTAFAHTDHDLSHGIDGRIGLRNSPALMNLAWSSTFMWDGAIHHLDMQALAPISHPDEMGENLVSVIEKLQRHPHYPSRFENAFGSSEITGEHLLKSFSAFLITLVSSQSKYDRVMLKQSTFSDQEQKGYLLFQQHCNRCHQEPLFTNYTFQSNGLPVDTTLNDFGRMRITQKKEDSLLFKVPTLRNIQYTKPYMHDGRFRNLTQVMKHYAANNACGTPLSSTDQVELIAFLHTLSDSSFVFNKKIAAPFEGK